MGRRRVDDRGFEPQQRADKKRCSDRGGIGGGGKGNLRPQKNSNPRSVLPTTFLQSPSTSTVSIPRSTSTPTSSPSGPKSSSSSGSSSGKFGLRGGRGWRMMALRMRGGEVDGRTRKPGACGRGRIDAGVYGSRGRRKIQRRRERTQIWNGRRTNHSPLPRALRLPTQTHMLLLLSHHLVDLGPWLVDLEGQTLVDLRLEERDVSFVSSVLLAHRERETDEQDYDDKRDQGEDLAEGRGGKRGGSACAADKEGWPAV